MNAKESFKKVHRLVRLLKKHGADHGRCPLLTRAANLLYAQKHTGAARLAEKLEEVRQRNEKLHYTS